MARPSRGGPQLPYRLLAGVTPSPKGWLVVSAKLQGIQISPNEPEVFERLADVLDYRPSFEVVALNAPIGLLAFPQKGGRSCDREARRLLGWPRAGAVLTPPIRDALLKENYEDAAAVSGGMDAVTWYQLPRIREVTSEMASYRQRTVYEVHAELSFFQLNEDQPLRHPKRTKAGLAERRTLLDRRIQGIERTLDIRLEGVRAWHLLDAAAALWTSRRIMAKAATRIPEDPEWDEEGVRMEIVR